MAKDSNVTVDVNKAIEQGEALAEKLWAGVTGEATSVVVSVVNNTQWDLKHLGGFQWQGKANDPAKDIAAGGAGGWMMHSNGLDGSFSMQVWQMQWPGGAHQAPFLTVGELVYMTGAQSKMTAIIDPINRIGEGSAAAKEQALVLLDKGRATGWTDSTSVLGPDHTDMTSFEIRTLITSKAGVTNGVTCVVTLNQL